MVSGDERWRGQTDRRTDIRTDRRTDGGTDGMEHSYIPLQLSLTGDKKMILYYNKCIIFNKSAGKTDTQMFEDYSQGECFIGSVLTSLSDFKCKPLVFHRILGQLKFIWASKFCKLVVLLPGYIPTCLNIIPDASVLLGLS